MKLHVVRGFGWLYMTSYSSFRAGSVSRSEWQEHATQGKFLDKATQVERMANMPTGRSNRDDMG